MDPFHNDNQFQDIMMNALYWGQYLRDSYGEELVPYMFMWNGNEKFTNMLQPGGDPEEFAYRIAAKSERDFDYFVIGYEGMMGSADGPKEKAIIIKAYKRSQEKGVFLAQLFDVNSAGKFSLKDDPILVDTPNNPLDLQADRQDKPYEDVVSSGMVLSNDAGMERYMPFFTHDNPAAIAGSIKNYVRQKLATVDKNTNGGEFSIQVNPMNNGSTEFMKYVVLDTVRSEKERPTTKAWEQETGRKVSFDVSYGDDKWLQEIAVTTEVNTNVPVENPHENQLSGGDANLAATNTRDKENKQDEYRQTEKQYEAEYASLSAMELKREVTRIRSIPNARTNVDALMRMTALMGIMETKGIDLPGQRSGSSYAERTAKKKGSEGGTKWGLYIGIAVLIIIIRMILRNM